MLVLPRDEVFAGRDQHLRPDEWSCLWDNYPNATAIRIQAIVQCYMYGTNTMFIIFSSQTIAVTVLYEGNKTTSLRVGDQLPTIT